MELNIKEQTEKLQGEANQLASKVRSMDEQLAMLNNQKQQVMNELIKKLGGIELLQSLEKDTTKPKEKQIDKT